MDQKELEQRERKSLYIGGWILLGLGMAYLFLYQVLGISLGGPPCLFHAVTGAYCPGCGGTRAVTALLQGKLLTSLYYHPVVVYGAVLYFWFMVSNTAEYLSAGKVPIGLRWHKWFAAGGVILLVINFLLKNALFFIWKIPMG